MNITRGKIKSALKVVVYGQEGVGKSTFASKFPNPVFIDTEGSTKQLDVARFDAPTSWEMLLQQVDYIKKNNTGFQTLVIDTADWAEKLCIKKVCSKAQKDGIEDFGWGKGYVYVQEEFGKLLNSLEEVVQRGINVVITAHAKMNKVEQPDEMGAYDRWELKLTKQCSPMLKEWADMLLFANYKTLVVRTDDKKYKGQGGQQRIMYTAHTAAWDAKNRFDLPEVIPLDYAQIKHIIEHTVPEPHEQEIPVAPPVSNDKPKEENKTPLENLIEDFKENDIPVTEIKAEIVNVPEYVPKALADLMRANQVSVEDIENVVAQRGYFPKGTPLKDYPSDFIEGCLIGAWEQVYQLIISNKDLPF